jgi:hypothetical protein
MLIDDDVIHRVIKFLDGNGCYNQLFTADEDMNKIAFRCTCFVGLFEWVVMTFSLKKCQCYLSKGY